MLPEIHERLKRWTEWNLRREDGGLGYPKQCAYTRLQANTGSGYFAGIESEAWDTEQAVIELKKQSPSLWLVIHVRYLRTMSQEQRCKACGCGETVFFQRLHQAHEVVRKILRENIAANA